MHPVAVTVLLYGEGPPFAVVKSRRRHHQEGDPEFLKEGQNIAGRLRLPAAEKAFAAGSLDPGQLQVDRHQRGGQIEIKMEVARHHPGFGAVFGVRSKAVEVAPADNILAVGRNHLHIARAVIILGRLSGMDRPARAPPSLLRDGDGNAEAVTRRSHRLNYARQRRICSLLAGSGHQGGVAEQGLLLQRGGGPPLVAGAAIGSFLLQDGGIKAYKVAGFPQGFSHAQALYQQSLKKEGVDGGGKLQILGGEPPNIADRPFFNHGQAELFAVGDRDSLPFQAVGGRGPVRFHPHSGAGRRVGHQRGKSRQIAAREEAPASLQRFGGTVAGVEEKIAFFQSCGNPLRASLLAFKNGHPVSALLQERRKLCFQERVVGIKNNLVIHLGADGYQHTAPLFLSPGEAVIIFRGKDLRGEASGA